MSRLIHYSEKSLASVYSVAQDDCHSNFKPSGLWVSVEGDADWPSWCRDENFHLGRLTHQTEIILAPTANILRISDAAGLDEFTKEFAYSSYGVNWPAVAEKWQGIIIAPYCYERRLAGHATWYYTWDCASGCIWDAAAVAELRPAAIPQSMAA